MKRGRKPLAMPRVPIRVYFRVDLLAEMELLLSDPLREKVKYGARGEYLEQLVERDMAERRRKAEADEPPTAEKSS